MKSEGTQPYIYMYLFSPNSPPQPISFYFLIAVVWTSNTMLSKSGKNVHPCFCSWSLMKNLQLFKIACYLWVCHKWPLLCWDMSYLYLHCWKFLIMNGWWILSKAFSVSNEMITWFLSFALLMWYITLVDLWMLNYPWFPRVNPIWS